ncbi:hypothetical protein [Microbulbifer celer]|uniref:Uncharacterized protein n=1 Tax=Microbulbifer celer TaxID=435905 RepID=A0ABW3UCL5_9GAMM|nr:hypothetical protein [Microbulbifer celer]UFN56845.1 hypothetical protein LPW13_14910 [Microbulbifer celer]
MWEKILIGFIGAIIALAIKEFIDCLKRRAKSKLIASMAVKHLELIKSDLIDHVVLDKNNATFGETQYCEVVVGDFLYDLITSNIDCFSSAKDVEKSTLFFHKYKVNMATVKARLDNSVQKSTTLKIETYRALVAALEDALSELSGIANA